MALLTTFPWIVVMDVGLLVTARPTADAIIAISDAGIPHVRRRTLPFGSILMSIRFSHFSAISRGRDRYWYHRPAEL
jgi:hypothetical protein